MTTQTLPIFHTVTAPREVPESRVRDLLCTAFEGWMSNWATKPEMHLRDGLKPEDLRTNHDTGHKGSEAAKVGEYFPSYQLCPFIEGCHLSIQDTEEEDDNGKPVVYRLDRESMVAALDLMAKEHPQHFNNFMEESDDAITGDVFLQLACMGEVVYG